jgi:hypothetical protein
MAFGIIYTQPKNNVKRGWDVINSTGNPDKVMPYIICNGKHL